MIRSVKLHLVLYRRVDRFNSLQYKIENKFISLINKWSSVLKNLNIQMLKSILEKQILEHSVYTLSVIHKVICEYKKFPQFF